MEKGIFVREIQPGQDVSGLFCVASKSIRQTRSGSPFISMTLMDNSGSIEARVWDRARELEVFFEKGDIIYVQAEAVDFNDQCQLKVNDLNALEPGTSIDPAMFLSVTSIDRDEYWMICQKAMKSIKNPEFRMVLKEVFSAPEMQKSFCEAPAAKKMHHAYIGGLLEHSVNLLRLSRVVCGLYPYLDRDLMVAASLCHDIGKTREYSWERPPIDYTDQGRLLGHIAIGLEMVEKAVDTARLNQNSRKLLALKHVILSHHGQREFGSPVLPMTEEALVFHMIDDLDAKLNFLSGLKGDGTEPEWTDFQRLLERYFYLGPKASEAAAAREPRSERGSVRRGRSQKEEEDNRSKPAQARLWDQ